MVKKSIQSKFTTKKIQTWHIVEWACARAKQKNWFQKQSLESFQKPQNVQL